MVYIYIYIIYNYGISIGAAVVNKNWSAIKGGQTGWKKIQGDNQRSD